MGYLLSAWGLVLGMSAWATYLYFAWANADSLPMQWGLTGKPTWFATRGAAVAFFPILAIFVVGMMSFAKKHQPLGTGTLLMAALLVAIQAIWVFFARRYV